MNKAKKLGIALAVITITGTAGTAIGVNTVSYTHLVSHIMFSCVGGLKEQIQQISGYGAQQDTKYNGHGNIDKVHNIGVSTLCNSKECGKEYNDEDIITRCTGQDLSLIHI